MPTYYSDCFMDFIRHPTAGRYVIRVRPDGSVRVTVPRWGSRRQAELFAEQQRPWIERQRAQVRESAAHGLSYSPRGDQGAAPAGGARASRAAVPPGRTPRRPRVARERPESALALGILLALRSHLPELATRADARSVREYVLIHELMHLRRLDHSRHFWRLVAHACPELRATREVAPRTQIPARQPDAPYQPSNSRLFNPAHQRPMVRSVPVFQLSVACAPSRRRHERTCNRGREGQDPRGLSEAASPEQLPEKARCELVASMPRIEIGPHHERAVRQQRRRGLHLLCRASTVSRTRVAVSVPRGRQDE